MLANRPLNFHEIWRWSPGWLWLISNGITHLHLLHGSVFVCAEHLNMLQELLARAYKWGLTAAALCYFCLQV